jgi:hypothetical protein
MRQREILTVLERVGKAPRVFHDGGDNDGSGGLRAGDRHKDETHACIEVLVDCHRRGLARPWQRDLRLEQKVIHESTMQGNELGECEGVNRGKRSKLTNKQ